MAAPFKRLCSQAARQPRRISHRRPSVQQCQRSLSTTPSRLQAEPVDQSDDNPFLTSFPSGSTRENSQGNTALDPTFEEDDLSALAHRELDQHRELREMIRTAAWEMPLLSSLHKPFEPPKRENLPLRWRYTTYMGEQHPAASKVVVEFDPKDVQGMEEWQRQKLIKLVGTRFDVVKGKGRVKMSCESFGSQAQNKRYLGDVMKNLITEAKDATDKFEDVPMDARHSKQKPRVRFPTAWRLTEERKRELEGIRRTQLLEEGAKIENDKLISGVAAIEADRQFKLQKIEEPVMAEARQPLPRGKMGKKEMGQQRVQR